VFYCIHNVVYFVAVQA